MKQQAIDLGAKTAFSAKESAAGMENLASAGFSAQEIMKAMPGNILKFVSHLLEVVPGQIQSIDFGSTLQEVKAASEKQEAARHLGIC
ncbi:phage tail tape measure protein, partial [Enterococcus faecium]|uniref:phage tail tape measure protein n=1 Tax=Enterococcus faecium TaxID=1352 RepID=UPI0029301238